MFAIDREQDNRTEATAKRLQSMINERAQKALFQIEGPDEDGCVWACSPEGSADVWRQNLGPASNAAEVMARWLKSFDNERNTSPPQCQLSSLDHGVESFADLQRLISEGGGGPHYVYVLRWPHGMPAGGAPFYVGIGQGMRLFSHEEEARDPTRKSAKTAAIREIWDAGKEVLRTIDSVHSIEPWDREEQLINEIGRLADGTGPLTNAQTYSPSTKIGGVELRKYAGDHAATGDISAPPPKFKLRSVRLMAGPRKPPSAKTVMGKLYEVAAANPGATGEELIQLLQAVDFSANRSAYTQSGKVSASWLAGYIEGAFSRSDCQYLQEYRT